MAKDVGAGWDTDGDAVLSESEFATGFRDRGIFGNWDQDSDGLLSGEEFSGGVYGTYTEFGVAEGEDMGVGAAGFWSDDDWGEVGMLGEWDTDGDAALSEDEFSTGVFGEYDQDGTGIIEEPELTDIGDDMGDEGFWDV